MGNRKMPKFISDIIKSGRITLRDSNVVKPHVCLGQNDINCYVHWLFYIIHIEGQIYLWCIYCNMLYYTGYIQVISPQELNR